MHPRTSQVRFNGPLVAIAIPLLFLPAAVGLGWQLWHSNDLDKQCLLLAVLLLCLDQARMAGVDLQDVAAIRATLAQPDSRLDRFHWVTLSTVVIELFGFYGTGFGMIAPTITPTITPAIAGGAILVLLSQLWFHMLAGVQLFPGEAEPIQDCGIGLRSPVLIADTIGIILLVLWSLRIAPLGMAIALLAMVGLYAFAKYGLPLLQPSPPNHPG